jgi:hypothetical protein
MINFQNLGEISPIYLTVVLIIYLMIVELSNKKIKRALTPFIIILVIIFFVIALTSIYSTYIKIK